MDHFWHLASAVAPSVPPLAWMEMSMIWKIDDEHQKLQRTYRKLQDLVDFLCCKSLSICGGNDGLKALFEKTREYGYDADALLEHIWMLLSRSSNTSNEERRLRSMVLYSPGELLLPLKIAQMQEKLDGLIREVVTWDELYVNLLKNYYSGRSSGMSSNSSEVPQYVVGREKDKDCIVNLLSKNDGTNFSVISIIGMGGIGKTTLAKIVYDDAQIVYDDASEIVYDDASFHRKIWVTVSVGFDAIKIIKSIIEYATLSACSLSDLDSLKLKLINIIWQKKFLIVLDDYWSEDCDDWKTLSRLFQCGSRGSKVIVTTRNMKVSEAVCSKEKYILETLSKDDCWEIIKQRALTSEELSSNLMTSVEVSPNLKSVGMSIAKKCEGIPHVANVLGNMLSGKSTEEWFLVLKRDMWLPENNILRHLIQSYLHLPTHLRKCFAYCSIFPQGYEFEMEELINLWIAEGYIRPQAHETSQQLARSYFEDLHSRFFFYQCRPYSNQRQIRYKMQDLIHGMAQLLSEDICFHRKHEEYPLFGKAYHLSLNHDGSQPLILKASVKNERLRTFLVMNSSSNAGATGKLDLQLFLYLKFLRVLGLAGAGLEELVDSIAQLQHLRYLNISDNPIYRIPKSVCTIVALEILKLRNCPNLYDLPENMSSLINLGHLEFDESMLTHMPPHFRNLVELQYLSAYIAGKENGCGIGELESLNCLAGKLCIRKIEVSNAREAREANLNLKIHLYKLDLTWTSMGQHNEETQSKQAEVFASLRPHLNLKELVIKSYFGLTYPPWLSDPSHNFTSIDLNGLKYCNHLPSLGELPCLKSFSISNMPSLVLIHRTFYGENNAVKFPSLNSFQLRGLSMLILWEDVIGGNADVMPRLRVFTLHDCQMLCELPPKLQTLLRVSNVSRCPKLRL